MSALLVVALVEMVLCVASARAETTHESEVWLEAGVGAHLPWDLEIGLTTTLKFDDGVSRLGSILPELELRYEALSWLAFGGGYRLIVDRNKRSEFEVGHRLFANGQATFGLSDLHFKYRLRLQNEWEWDRDGELQNRPTLRNLIGVRYKWAKWLRPSVSAEHFLALESLSSTPTRKWRFTVGPRFEIAKTEVELFYRIEIADDDEVRAIAHIVGLSVFVTPWSE